MLDEDLAECIICLFKYERIVRITWDVDPNWNFSSCLFFSLVSKQAVNSLLAYRL